MTAPEVVVAEAREALLRGPMFRVERAETTPGDVKALAADGVEFPKGRGLYAISDVTPSCVEAGALDAPVGPGGLLYVGKAEKSLAQRDVRQHFGTGKTGWSTVRRSFAALLRDELGLVPVPRATVSTTSTAPATFALAEESDVVLTEWMTEHLALRVWTPPSNVVLAAVEREVIADLNPPLNLTHAGPRPLLKAARKAMVGAALEVCPSGRVSSAS
ncbi:GIY-YIG nuclease family protein [Micrococcus luteus]|uniref:GIY-YIG nuclease family protein n=1 Tax=Micrococcus luteus TaxID=1270 RepID=UPI0035156980